MKKIFLFCFLFIFCLSIVKSDDLGLAKNSETAILMEASTKKVIFEKESHKEMAPASMTKIMTLLLTMESLEKGNIKLDDPDARQHRPRGRQAGRRGQGRSDPDHPRGNEDAERDRCAQGRHRRSGGRQDRRQGGYRRRPGCPRVRRAVHERW